MIGVYQIYNIKNDKKYIGSSADIKYRWKEHSRMLKGNYHYNIHLQRAWNKYGEDAFRFEDILECEPELCVPYEQWFLDHWKPEYNMCPVGGSPLGYKHTDEAKENMSRARIGKKLSQETKAKISRAKMGHPRSDEVKANISKAKQGSKNNRAKLSDLDIYEIRRLCATGKVTHKILGKMFRITTSNISNIACGQTWRHI